MHNDKQNPIEKLTNEELIKAYLGAISEDSTDNEFLVELQDELKRRNIDPLK